jgi:hypothetical protein
MISINIILMARFLKMVNADGYAVPLKSLSSSVIKGFTGSLGHTMIAISCYRGDMRLQFMLRGKSVTDRP